MKPIKSLSLISLTAALLLGAPSDKQDTEQQKAIELGNNSSALLLKTLTQSMKAHMEKGCVLDALNFCTTEAYPLTQKVNSELPKGVEVKRISLKYRNPANAPRDDETKVLESFNNFKNTNIVLPDYIIKIVDEHTYKYYKPIIMQNPVCLKCHGDISKNVELKKVIDDSYPADKATLYKMGDVRGAVLVTIKH